MLETKSFTVHPEQEQATIDLAANFGWSLKSSQEINNTDSHLENRGGEIYNVTTKEHYVKLVLERDTNMKNYDRVRQLENTYFSIMEREPECKVVRINKIIAIIGLLLYVAPGVLYLAFKIWRKAKARKDYEQAYTAWLEEEKVAQDALKESRSLV